ncbi:GlxA family transcriptional regulator [Rhizobium giardinii]|uniref:GlxA family transcriptional regulator n=1 Tax=Rhizobium giardinii TaxID=56731 RepID=UPI000DD886DE
MERLDKATRWFSFYLIEEFSLQAFSSALAVLRLANEVLRDPGYKWRIVTRTGGPAFSSCGVQIAADGSIEQERELLVTDTRTSMAVICGGHGMASGFRELDTWLRECRIHRIPIAALAGAAFVPARAGLLKGRRCAVHWEQFPAFSEQFSDIEATQTLFEIDGGFFSSAGGEAAFDLFLRIVEQDYGDTIVDRVCEKALSDRTRDLGEKQRLPLQTRFGVAHPGLIKVIEQMEANLVEPLRMGELAPASGLSRRQIERLFHREFGRSPARYYLEIRLEKADLLIQHSSLPIVEIAIACGFISASHFSKAYRETYGMAPQQKRMSTLADRPKPGSRQVDGRAIAQPQALSA